MNFLNLTLPTAAANLALDEALLECCSPSSEVLRVWELPSPAVIVGRASRLAEEVNRQACDRAGIPILRRCSGGAAVLLGPGCLAYSVVLATGHRPELAEVQRAHQFVLARIQQALEALGMAVERSGTSDLTLDGRKFSGNSLRCRRDALLYHGTLLYQADLPQIAACLTLPPRQPDYRKQRSHLDFLTNLPATRDALRQALSAVWECQGAITDWPRAATERLVRERYSQAEWNLSR
jgi:lipoate-protein ligase A